MRAGQSFAVDRRFLACRRARKLARALGCLCLDFPGALLSHRRMRGAIATGGLLMAMLGARVAAAQPVPLVSDPPGTPPRELLPLPTRPLLAPLWPWEELPPRAPRLRHRSVGMMIAGIVITGVGAAIGASGMVMTATTNAEVGLLILLPVGGLALPGIGIPLWLSGSRSTYSWDTAKSSLPTVTGGARSLQMGWSF